MNWHTWDGPTRALYQALKEYRRSYEQFSKATPSPEVARARFDMARDNVIDSLQSSSVADRVTRVIASGNEDGNKGENVISILGGELDLEVKLSHFFGVKQSQVKKTFANGSQVELSKEGISSVEHLVSEIEFLHKKTVEKMERTRKNKVRLSKKKEKNNIRQGVVSVLFGSGCLVADSYLIKELPGMEVSYSAALIAFHQAAKDFVG